MLTLFVMIGLLAGVRDAGGHTPTEPGADTANRVVVPAGSPLRLVSVQNVFAQYGRRGDAVYFRSDADVVVDGRVAIRKGALAKASIEDVDRPLRGGGGGRMRIAIESIEAADGSTILLDGRLEQKGRDRRAESAALAVWDRSPGGLWVEGAWASVMKGAVASAVVADDAEVVGGPVEDHPASASGDATVFGSVTPARPELLILVENLPSDPASVRVTEFYVEGSEGVDLARSSLARVEWIAADGLDLPEPVSAVGVTQSTFDIDADSRAERVVSFRGRDTMKYCGSKTCELTVRCSLTDGGEFLARGVLEVRVVENRLEVLK